MSIDFKRIKKRLDKLNLYSVDIDIFELLNFKNMEIRHSRMMAFLLNSNAKHESKKYLKNLYEYLGFKDKSINKKSIRVVCEKEKNIDIFVKDNYNKIILVIENKINSKQQSNQLKKYYEKVNNKYKNYECRFLYLCKDDKEEIDYNWKQITYQTMFDEILFKEKIECKNKSIEKFIKDYKYIFMREFNMATKDNEKKNSLEFYKENKETLDVIYEYAEKEGLLKNLNIFNGFKMYYQI